MVREWVHEELQLPADLSQGLQGPKTLKNNIKLLFWDLGLPPWAPRAAYRPHPVSLSPYVGLCVCGDDTSAPITVVNYDNPQRLGATLHIAEMTLQLRLQL